MRTSSHGNGFLGATHGDHGEANTLRAAIWFVLSSTVLALAPWPVAQAAPAVVFAEDFSDGLAGWGATGLWAASTRGGNGTSAHYGIELSNRSTYDVGANRGELLSPVIDLPAGNVTLQFWTRWRGEGCINEHPTVLVETRNGAREVLIERCAPSGELVLSADMGRFATLPVRLVFLWDTHDAGNNDFEGWYVDDVRVLAGGAPTPTQADLAVKDVRVDQGATEGGNMTARAALHNLANTSVPAGFRVDFAVDGVVRLSQSYPEGMPAGYSLQIAAVLPAPSAGTHVLTVTADAGHELTEPNETNNAGDASFFVASAGPNLAAFLDLPPTQSLLEDHFIDARGEVANVGSESANVNITSEWRLDGQLVERVVTPAGLPAQARYPFFASIGPLEVGQHVLTFTVDVDGNFSETEESDNLATRVFNVSEAAQVSVDSLVVTREPTPWGQADPLARYVADIDVCNRGAPTLSGGLFLGLYSNTTVTSWRDVNTTRLDLDRDECRHLRFAFEAWAAIGDFHVAAIATSMNDGRSDDDRRDAAVSRLVEGRGGVVVLGGPAPASPTVRATEPIAWNAIENVGNMLNGNAPRALAETAANATYTNPVWRCADPAYANHVVCMQLNGEIGFGQLRACRPPAFPNLLATVVYTAGSTAFGAMEGATGRNPCQGGLARIANETLAP